MIDEADRGVDVDDQQGGKLVDARRGDRASGWGSDGVVDELVGEASCTGGFGGEVSELVFEAWCQDEGRDEGRRLRSGM